MLPGTVFSASKNDIWCVFANQEQPHGSSRSYTFFFRRHLTLMHGKTPTCMNETMETMVRNNGFYIAQPLVWLFDIDLLSCENMLPLLIWARTTKDAKNETESNLKRRILYSVMFVASSRQCQPIVVPPASRGVGGRSGCISGNLEGLRLCWWFSGRNFNAAGREFDTWRSNTARTQF